MMSDSRVVSRCPFSAAARNLDPHDGAFLKEPFPTLATLRNEEPIFFHEGLGYWVITRMEHAKAILGDPENFSADIVLAPITPLYPSTIAKFQASGFTAGGGSLVNDVNPEHDERRKWLLPALSPARMREMEPVVRRAVTRCIDRFVQRGGADLVDELAHEVPGVALLHFLGVPEQELERVMKWAAPTILFSWGKPTEAEQNHMADMLGEYWHYAKAHIERLRRNPGDDVVSLALRGQAEKGLWTDDELATMVINFTFAGHDTTANSSANAFYLLLTHPQSWQALVADASLIPNAVEECIRFGPAVISHRRRAVNDIRIGGADIKANDKVLIYFAAANRDEAVFEDSETFDIRRKGAGRHVTFGFGWHSCLGSPLARLELRVMLEELTTRLPHLSLVADQTFTYSPVNSTMRGPDHVLVRWDAVANPREVDRPRAAL
jgi:cytochrome P450